MFFRIVMKYIFRPSNIVPDLLEERLLIGECFHRPNFFDQPNLESDTSDIAAEVEDMDLNFFYFFPSGGIRRSDNDQTPALFLANFNQSGINSVCNRMSPKIPTVEISRRIALLATAPFAPDNAAFNNVHGVFCHWICSGTFTFSFAARRRQIKR